jgi:hypothetical protein
MDLSHDIQNPTNPETIERSTSTPSLHQWIHDYITDDADQDISGIMSSGKVEFDHQHSPFPGQSFALIMLVYWSSPLFENYVYDGPVMELLLLETTENGTSSAGSSNNSTTYKRGGKLRLREIKDLRKQSQIKNGKMEDAAWNEVIDELARNGWQVRTVTVV